MTYKEMVEKSLEAVASISNESIRFVAFKMILKSLIRLHDVKEASR